MGNLAQVEDLPEDAIAEDQNLVVLEVKNSGEEDYLPENNLNFELGGKRLEVFFDSVKGMKVGDEESTEIKFSLESKTEEKSKSKFDIRLRSLRKLKVPELNQDFFDKMQVKDLDDMRSKLEENLQLQKESALKAEYRSSILEQLPKQYEDFDLPETLIHEKENELENRIEEQTK